MVNIIINLMFNELTEIDKFKIISNSCIYEPLVYSNDVGYYRYTGKCDFKSYGKHHNLRENYKNCNINNCGLLKLPEYILISYGTIKNEDTYLINYK